jgi:hypothetical protein
MFDLAFIQVQVATDDMAPDPPTHLPLSIHSIYRVSQEECARLREGVPYVKIYRYNPKHLCPKLNGYGDNGHRKVRSCVCSTHYTFCFKCLTLTVP